MKRSLWRQPRRWLNAGVRAALALLPRGLRHAVFRRLIDCDPAPGPQLELKIAETQDELEACFRILHDAYVAAGFMRPDPSGLRVTIYHALPTTTTLCAKVDGRVVGTVSLIRDGVFGFPIQTAFDLTAVRARGGRIAEVSALAIDPNYRKTGGRLLFPLMKFMYEYCRQYFDTRHLVIAVNPNRIELYESLLLFERLQASAVASYDFANGAPAVGATLDLDEAPERFERIYGGRSPRKDLHAYFVRTRLPHIQWPHRRFHTTNDPVMTPALMDHFFNQRTQVFAGLDDRRRLLLRSIYDDPAYAAVLPPPQQTEAARALALRRHRRFSIRCPAELRVASYGDWLSLPMTVIEVSAEGFLAECAMPLPEGTQGEARIELGDRDTAVLQARTVRRQASPAGVYYGFQVLRGDAAWHRVVDLLQRGNTPGDLIGERTAAGLVLQQLLLEAERLGVKPPTPGHPPVEPLPVQAESRVTE